MRDEYYDKYYVNIMREKTPIIKNIVVLQLGEFLGVFC